jgi:hypothetical protein
VAQSIARHDLAGSFQQSQQYLERLFLQSDPLSVPEQQVSPAVYRDSLEADAIHNIGALHIRIPVAPIRPGAFVLIPGRNIQWMGLRR